MIVYRMGFGLQPFLLYQVANVSTIRYTHFKQVNDKKMPTFPHIDSKIQKKGLIGHFDNLNFWLRFQRNSFETKTMLLVMVQHVFHIVKTFG